MSGPERVLSADDAQTLPMPPHRIDRDDHGYGRVVCEGPPLSVCRLVCAEDCGAESWPCGDYDYEADEDREPHGMRDGGYCNVEEFLNGGDLDDLTTDYPDVARTYAGPIRVTWSAGDETYLWEPPTSPAGGQS